MYLKFLAFLFCLIWLGAVHAQKPVTPVAGAHSQLLIGNVVNQERFSGVARLMKNARCTSFLIDTKNDKGPAYILSCGHCIQDWDANGVFFNDTEEAKGYKAIFNYFVNATESFDTIVAKSMTYSTMKGLDFSVIELNTTLGNLKSRGIKAYGIAERPPLAKSKISIIGAPAGPFSQDSTFLRKIDCQLQGRADLKEGIFSFENIYRTDCLDVYGGGSGSPVFVEGQYEEVFAILNTTTIGATDPCGLSAPCEISKTELLLKENTSYAVPIDGVGNCFDANGNFNVKALGCPLNKGKQLVLKGISFGATASERYKGTDSLQSNSWNISVTGPFNHYRYKVGKVSQGVCTKAEGYGKVYNMADTPTINDEVPKEEGHYVLCVQGGNKPDVDSSWQELEQVSHAYVKIDNEPPKKEPKIELTKNNDSVSIKFKYDRPEHNSFYYYVAQEAIVDCPTSAPMTKAHWKNPLVIPLKNLPCSVCVKTADDAGNEGPIKKFRLE